VACARRRWMREQGMFDPARLVFIDETSTFQRWRRLAGHPEPQQRRQESRFAANRDGLRYPSDLTDDEWAIVAPMIPPARHGGRRLSVNVREVLNGIFYVLRTGCQWRALPKDLPPKSTVHDYLELWDWDGTLERIHHALYGAVREQEGREASPTVAIIDSQTAKGGQKGGLGSILRGYDAGKKIKGRKRHILVDTLGLLLNVVVHPADVQDRDGAFHLLRRARRMFPFIERIFADGGYAGRKMALTVWRTGAWRLQIRQAIRHRRIRGPSQTMDCREDLRMDQSKSPPGSRLRALHDHRRRLLPHRHDPHLAQATCCKPLVMNPNFPYRLWVVKCILNLKCNDRLLDRDEIGPYWDLITIICLDSNAHWTASSTGKGYGAFFCDPMNELWQFL
jgi:transposase